MATAPGPVRGLWQLLEPLHAVLYYAPEVTAEAERLGFDTTTRWPSYFAWRTAPLGEPGAALATATCYSFSPRTVAAHVPAAWATAASSAVLEARAAGVDRGLRAVLGEDVVRSAEVAEAAALVREAAESADTAGRPLGAANADLPWPDEPHLVLWHAATVLREHRGDGHVAALQAAGLDPVESLVSFAAVGAAPVEVFASRGWTAQEWADGADRLRERGLVEDDGTATPAGRALRDDVEATTDRLATQPWAVLGSRVGRLPPLVGPLTRAVATSGLLPATSTLGIRPVRPG